MVLWVSGGVNRPVSNFAYIASMSYRVAGFFFCAGDEHIIWLSDLSGLSSIMIAVASWNTS